MRVEIEIQELVPHGCGQIDGAGAAESIERALRLQLADAVAERVQGSVRT